MTYVTHYMENHDARIVIREYTDNTSSKGRTRITLIWENGFAKTFNSWDTASKYLKRIGFLAK